MVSDLDEIVRQRTVSNIPIEHLEQLPTRKLLGRLQELRKCHDNFQCTDWLEEDIAKLGDRIAFKDSIEWKEAYNAVKRILNNREHIPRINKKANKILRQEAGRNRRNR